MMHLPYKILTIYFNCFNVGLPILIIRCYSYSINIFISYHIFTENIIP